MAIIVEEDKNRSGATSLLGSAAILIIILIAAYYIFFASVAPSTILAPTNFGNIAAISQVHFNAATVIQSQNFQSLKQYVAEPSSTGPAAVGRNNPFIAP